MRGKKLLEVLKIIGRIAGDTADFIDAIVTPESTKGGKYIGLTGYRPYRGRRRVSTFFDPAVSEAKQRQRAYEFLYHLKKDNLIEKEKLGRKLIWRVTRKGREKERFLKKICTSSDTYETFR